MSADDYALGPWWRCVAAEDPGTYLPTPCQPEETHILCGPKLPELHQKEASVRFSTEL